MRSTARAEGYAELGPRGVKALPPAYFSVVMATGIVALASYLQTNVRGLAWGLTFLNAAIFVILWAMLLARIVRYPRQVHGDIKDFNRGPGFFAIVAGTAVLGSQLLVIFNRPTVATVLWFVAIPLWAYLHVCDLY